MDILSTHAAKAAVNSSNNHYAVINKSAMEIEVADASPNTTFEELGKGFLILILVRVPIISASAPLKLNYDNYITILVGKSANTPVNVLHQIGLPRAITSCMAACMFRKECRISAPYKDLTGNVPGVNLSLIKMDGSTMVP